MEEVEQNDGETGEKLFKAAETGNTSLFTSLERHCWCQNYFLSTTTHNHDNILHLAVQNKQLKFVKEALLRFPTLLAGKNANGDTSLHIASRIGDVDAISFLISHSHNNNSIHITSTTSTTASDANVVDGDVDGDEDEDDNDGWLFAQNSEGNTPLHVAIMSRSIKAVSTFCRECTHSQLERLFPTPNRHARTALHLLARYFPANDLFEDWEDISSVYRDIFICADQLRCTQDENSNTPLHLAIKNTKFSAAKLLLQRCLGSEKRQELSIRNSDGDSIFDLLANQIVHMTHMPSHIEELKEMMVRAGRLVKDESFVERKMDDELYKAALAMDPKVLAGVRRRDNENEDEDVECGLILNSLDNHFLSQTPYGSNIIHIALQQGKEEGVKFIEEALNRFPSLVIQADSNGDTPLHLASRLFTPVSKTLFLCFGDVYERVCKEHTKGVLDQPWMAKNSKGYMPIHEALRFNNVFAALALMEIDPFTASYVNDFGETPLHMYARFGFFPVEQQKDQVSETLITKHKAAAYARDGDGLTPLLRAAKCGRLRTVLAILEHCPQSAYIQDPNGRTFLHLLRFIGGDLDEHSADHLFEHLGKNLFQIQEADAQRIVLDNDGNTPLHYAIKNENSITAELLTRRCLETMDQPELMLLNNDGDRVLDLLGSHEVPIVIVELIRKRHPNVMYSARSSFGVRRVDIKNSAGSLSVIAGLLATITFAAAFQVPGGFNGDSGSPVLLKRVAFQVFLLSDAFAMCSSMVVLFSLLWVMGSCKTFDSFVLLDISFILLQASFYSTLVAFMTGVYVATASKALWLAIFSCALGAIVILVTWRSSVLFFSKHIKLMIDMLLTGKGFSSYGEYLKHHSSLVGGRH